MIQGESNPNLVKWVLYFYLFPSALRGKKQKKVTKRKRKERERGGKDRKSTSKQLSQFTLLKWQTSFLLLEVQDEEKTYRNIAFYYALYGCYTSQDLSAYGLERVVFKPVSVGFSSRGGCWHVTSNNSVQEADIGWVIQKQFMVYDHVADPPKAMTQKRAIHVIIYLSPNI